MFRSRRCRLVEDRTDWSIRRLVQATRRYRTIQRIHPAGDRPLNRLRRGTAERGRATPSSHLPVGGMVSIRSLADFEGAPGRHVERGVRTSQAVVVTLADGHADVMEPAATDPTRLIPYAGHVIRVLGECQGLAICELTVPPRFAGPPAHIHHDFDEAIYVLSGH